MKKTAFIIIMEIATIVATILVVFTYNSYKEKKYEKLVEEPGIKEVKEADFNLPKFTILVEGIYYSTISDVDIIDLKTYFISAVMDYSVRNDYKTYNAIKLKDIFELYGIEDYNNVIFKSNGNLQVKFKKEEINDDFYLTFSENGINYPEDEPVNLLCPDYNARYSLTNIVEIDFE